MLHLCLKKCIKKEPPKQSFILGYKNTSHSEEWVYCVALTYKLLRSLPASPYILGDAFSFPLDYPHANKHKLLYEAQSILLLCMAGYIVIEKKLIALILAVSQALPLLFVIFYRFLHFIQFGLPILICL